LAEPTAFAAFVATCRATNWVVYAKPPFAGPTQVLESLGRYTHRVAISNDRLVNLEAGPVRFRWNDYAHANRVKTMTLPAEEFLRRFLLHVLPASFVRIRHCGVLANRGRTAKLARCRVLRAVPPPAPSTPPEAAATLLHRLTGVDITRCPVCRAGRLRPPGLCTTLLEAPEASAPRSRTSLPAGRPRPAAGKALPSTPGFRYNPHSF